jgi:hypothetical protein
VPHTFRLGGAVPSGYSLRSRLAVIYAKQKKLPTLSVPWTQLAFT